MIREETTIKNLTKIKSFLQMRRERFSFPVLRRQEKNTSDKSTSKRREEEEEKKIMMEWKVSRTIFIYIISL